MPLTGSYFDLAILMNGIMDAFILVIAAKVLHIPIKGGCIAGGVLIGEFPVVWSFFDHSFILTLSKFLTPVAMVWVAYRPKDWRKLLRELIVFLLLAAGLGGFVYALWYWAQYRGPAAKNILQLTVSNLWFLPFSGIAWWLGQKAWLGWQKRCDFLHKNIYDIEIDFGKADRKIKTKAFVDTGNNLRDPINGKPVMLLEEELAAAALPDEIVNLLQQPWQEGENPWPRLWQENPLLMKTLVFIPFRSIQQQSWLPAVRPQQVLIHNGDSFVAIQATVALVKQVLSSEGEYRALLHPELTGKRGDKGA